LPVCSRPSGIIVQQPNDVAPRHVGGGLMTMSAGDQFQMRVSSM
jgi:hypothetical protein